MKTQDISQLQSTAAKLRSRLVEISHKRKIPHLASSLSCIDILTVLYDEILKIGPEFPYAEDRDRFLLSKGHAASSLYVTLAEFGFFGDSLPDTQGLKDSPLEEHPRLKCVPGIENASGSLGHALSLAIGISLAARINKQNYKTYVLLGDGECNEGSVWEAAMFASSQKLNNLVAIVDFNKWQATDRSCEVMAINPLREKWEAFGWHAVEIDGHDFDQLFKAFSITPPKDKPLAIIANTIKGKGVSFMEDDNNWHYRIPTAEQVILAKKELSPQIDTDMS